MSRRHEISSSPENMVWGYIDSATPPVLEIASGDTVTLHSFPAGGKECLPEDRSLEGMQRDRVAGCDLEHGRRGTVDVAPNHIFGRRGNFVAARHGLAPLLWFVSVRWRCTGSGVHGLRIRCGQPRRRFRAKAPRRRRRG